MPPDRKPQPLRVEEPQNDYERQRIENIMRNNQRAQALGINKLVQLLKQSKKVRKSKGCQGARNKDKEGLIDKVSEENLETLPDNNLPTHTTQSAGTRSKRVIATENQVQPTRLTRQRIREQQQVEASDEGVQDSSTNADVTHPDSQNNLCNEGQLNFSEERVRGISLVLKEIGALKKQLEETDAILRRLLSLNK